MKAKHTPTPWSLDPTGDIGWWMIGTSETPVAEVSIEFKQTSEAKANAAFIIQAANAHELLVSALRRLRVDAVAFLRSKPVRAFDETLAEVDAALLACAEKPSR